MKADGGNAPSIIRYVDYIGLAPPGGICCQIGRNKLAIVGYSRWVIHLFTEAHFGYCYRSFAGVSFERACPVLLIDFFIPFRVNPTDLNVRTGVNV